MVALRWFVTSYYYSHPIEVIGQRFVTSYYYSHPIEVIGRLYYAGAPTHSWAGPLNPCKHVRGAHVNELIGRRYESHHGER